MDIHERLRQARAARGFKSAADAAKKLKIPYGTYSGHENGFRGIPRDKVAEYSKKLRVSDDWLLTGEGTPHAQTAPIVGLAGAGPEGTVIFSDAQGDLGEAPMPPGGNESTAALEVRGDSMRGIADDGWLVYFDDRRNPPTEDLLGELCIVGLVDGRVMIKYLIRGRRKNSYDLESVAAPTLRDVKVEWAALVTAIIPRRQARRLVVRGAA
jgi:phage repressor protein C with HTH and peptisase S24 domain